MVGKLIKYDFMSFFRLLFPVQLIIIGIAAISRIVQIFENDSSAYKISFISSIVLLSISCVVALIMTIVISIVRFYQGMYSNEGYLSHTLPVTPAQHIIAKLIVSIIFEIGSIFAIFLALNVVTLGEVATEVYKAGFYLFGEALEMMQGHVILYLIEAIVLLLVWEATAFLMFYFCLSIGQLVNRKKILLAFGVFFGLYMLAQIFFTIMIITGTALAQNDSWINLARDVLDWVAVHRLGTIHLVLCGMILINGIFGFVYFIITKLIMTVRLNLT